VLEHRRIDLSAVPIPGSRDHGVAFSQVRKAFGEVLALEDVTFEIERHARIGIVGPSGGGKSTLLQLTAGCSNRTAVSSTSRVRRMRKAVSLGAR
jgi:ABC-type branched-subunit amino acid transport system ATPase component